MWFTMSYWPTAAAAFGAFVTKLSYLHVLAQQIRSSRELLEKARGKSNLFFPPNSMEEEEEVSSWLLFHLSFEKKLHSLK